MHVTISLAQMNIAFGSPAANLARAGELAGEAAGRGSHLLLLPELWSSGYDLTRSADLARENQALLPEIAGLANRHQMLVGGSLLLERDGRVYNTFTCHRPGEFTPVTYEKIHLFRLMDEEQWLAPGSRPQQMQVAGVEAGLAVCYDLRFPELFRRYAVEGAALLLIAAEWPAARIEHWRILLRARAIENQCFVAAANAAGVTGEETFGGRSAIISPWGEVLAEGGPGTEELLTATVDLDDAARARERIPILKDRRPEIYG